MEGAVVTLEVYALCLANEEAVGMQINFLFEVCI